MCDKGCLQAVGLYRVQGSEVVQDQAGVERSAREYHLVNIPVE